MQCDTNLVYYKNSTEMSERSSNDSNKEKINKNKNSCKHCCFSFCFLCHFVCPCCKYYSIKTYVLILSFMILSSTTINGGYISAIMTSLQRQYNLSTSKIGIILSSYDIISIFSIPLISYLGAKTNRPRLMAIFSLIYVLGCGIFILPYFLGNKYIVNSSNIPVNNTEESLMYQTFDLCAISNASNYSGSNTEVTKNNQTTISCTASNDNMWSYYVFITGQLAMSLGVSPLFSLGLTYLCDNLEERSHALYTGFIYGSYALGPALGYVMASFLLSAWVNPSDPNVPNISESDPRWVGLWWAGFLASGGFMLIFFAFMISFPENLPDAPCLKNHKKKSVKSPQTENQKSLNQSKATSVSNSVINSEMTDFSSINSTSATESQKETKTKRFFKKLKSFLKSIAKLFCQIDYILLVLVISVECILAAGFTSFMVTFTQNQFQVDPSKSSILTGGVVVPSAIVGAILGGFVVRKFDLHIEGCIRLILAGSTITIIGIALLLIVECPGEPSNGIDITTQTLNKTATQCNYDCSCGFSYSPMCSNGITYASPCLVGCTHANMSGYYDCSCLSNGNNSTANIGACSRNCDTKLIIFMSILFVVIAAEGFCMTPATILLLKLVDQSLQSFALGLLKCLNILLAYIPAPIVFSKLIDNTCILWNYYCNDDKGTCLEYDIKQFHYLFLGVALGVKTVGFLLLITTFIYIHKRKILKPFYSKTISLNSKSKRNQKKRNSIINSEIAISTIDNDIDSYKNLNIVLKSQSHKQDSKKIPNSGVEIKRANSSESLDTIMTSLSNLSSNTNTSGTTSSSSSSRSSGKSNKLSHLLQFNDSNTLANPMDIIHEENCEANSIF